MAPVVKICGLRSTEAASRAVESGADMLGVIMVPNRKRTVSPDVAMAISKEARLKRKQLKRKFQTAKQIVEELSSQKYTSHNEYFDASAKLICENGPFLVGVFRNQNIEDVFRSARQCSLDFIQLHGSESTEDYLQFNEHHDFGIIRRFVIPDDVASMSWFFPNVPTSEHKGFLLPLLDSEAGGEGKPIDWSLINDLDGRFILAGGLSPDNLEQTRPYLRNVVGFDVSGGVENVDGEKNLEKIDAFVVNAKKL